MEERLVVVEMEKDRFFRKTEESKALEMAAQEERSRLKSLVRLYTHFVYFTYDLNLLF